jgi:hypothetical protein
MKPNELVNGQSYLYIRARSSHIKTAEYCATLTNMHKCPVFKINDSKSLWTYLYAQKRDIEQYILPTTKLWRLLYEN